MKYLTSSIGVFPSLSPPSPFLAASLLTRIDQASLATLDKDINTVDIHRFFNTHSKPAGRKGSVRFEGLRADLKMERKKKRILANKVRFSWATFIQDSERTRRPPRSRRPSLLEDWAF